MLDRYRPNQPSARGDAARTARLAVEHQETAARYLAAERRRKTVAVLLLVAVGGGGLYFFIQQRYSVAVRKPAPLAAAPSKDWVNLPSVRDAVFRALQSRGATLQQGDRAVLSDGNGRRELDLRPAEPRKDAPPLPK